jgi:hypothetical protein
MDIAVVDWCPLSNHSPYFFPSRCLSTTSSNHLRLAILMHWAYCGFAVGLIRSNCVRRYLVFGSLSDMRPLFSRCLPHPHARDSILLLSHDTKLASRERHVTIHPTARHHGCRHIVFHSHLGLPILCRLNDKIVKHVSC